MDAALLHTLHDAFRGDRMALLYAGTFPDVHTAPLIALGEAAIGDSDSDRSLRGRFAFLLVELYQNIVRHRSSVSHTLMQGAGRSLFLIRSNTNGQEVTSMNPIPANEQALLHEQLKALEGLGPESLKERYLESLQKESRTQRGGAGLGLIEMARRSGQPLHHYMAQINADHLLFTLQVRLDEHGGPMSDGRLLEVLHEAAAKGNILLAYKGLVDPAVERSILRMVAEEIGSERHSSALRHLLDVFRPASAVSDERLLVLSSGPDGPRLALLAQLGEQDAIRWEQGATRTANTRFTKASNARSEGGSVLCVVECSDPL